MTMWHEFSWSYPWYRLHVQASVNPTIHVAFNPILPGGEIADWDGMVFFSSLGEEVVQTAAIETFGLVSTYILAKCTSLTSFWGGIIVEGLKIGIQGALLLSFGWNSAQAMRASSLMSLVMLLFALTDFGSAVSNFLTRLIDELRWICGFAVTSLTVILKTLKDMFLWGRGASSSIVDTMEIVADAALAVIALRRSVDL